jgi:hypothetical protein
LLQGITTLEEMLLCKQDIIPYGSLALGHKGLSSLLSYHLLIK